MPFGGKPFGKAMISWGVEKQTEDKMYGSRLANRMFPEAGWLSLALLSWFFKERAVLKQEFAGLQAEVGKHTEQKCEALKHYRSELFLHAARTPRPKQRNEKGPLKTRLCGKGLFKVGGFPPKFDDLLSRTATR